MNANDIKNEQFISSGLDVITIESDALNALKSRIGDEFAAACRLLLGCQGRIVVTGMGKSGHIGNKIAATLASTGSPAFYVHPGEASHGDMGMIMAQDAVIALSNSGETPEILTILPLLKRLKIPLIALTGKVESSLAKAADVTLDCHIEKEACPLGLAPTASTTVTLALGDAIAISLLEARGFTEDDFALSHPGGSLGRRLLLRISDLMRIGDAIPCVKKTDTLNNALLEMTQKRLGMTTVVNDDGVMIGIYTDGDLRRTRQKGIDIHNTPVHDVMTTTYKTTHSETLAAIALEQMETHKITSLIIKDENGRAVGVVHLHDLLSANLT